MSKKTQTKTASKKASETKKSKAAETKAAEAAKTEEQKAYVEAHKKYTDVFGEMPDSKLSTEEILFLVKEKLEPEVEPEETQEPAAETQAADEVEEVEEQPKEEKLIDQRKVTIVNKKGEKKTLNRITWEILRKTEKNWMEEPKEVQTLKGSK